MDLLCSASAGTTDTRLVPHLCSLHSFVPTYTITLSLSPNLHLSLCGEKIASSVFMNSSLFLKITEIFI